MLLGSLVADLGFWCRSNLIVQYVGPVESERAAHPILCVGFMLPLSSQYYVLIRVLFDDELGSVFVGLCGGCFWPHLGPDGCPF